MTNELARVRAAGLHAWKDCFARRGSAACAWPLALAGALVAAVPPGEAVAQGFGAGPAERDAPIVVTGRREAETLRNAPASVSVFAASGLERAGVLRLRDVADRTPNFAMLDNYRPGLDRFVMRGLVSPQVGDPPLAFVIDGVTAPSAEFATQPLFDIERVEIMRGAQGALYGRGAVGGAIYIVSRPPTQELEGAVSASMASDDTRRLSAVLSGPVLRDAARFRLGGYGVEGDGGIVNPALQRGADFTRGQGWTADLRFEPAERTQIIVRASGGVSRDGIGYYDAIDGAGAGLEDFSIRSGQNVQGYNLRRLLQANATVETGLDGARLTLTGGFSRAHSTGVADADLTALPTDGVSFFPAAQRALDRLQAWTFEGRLHAAAPAGSRWRWALGGFFQDRAGRNVFSVFDDPSGGVLPVLHADTGPALEVFAIVDENESRAWAVSGEAEYAFSERLSVILAGRYDRDRRRSVDPRDARTTRAQAIFDAVQPKVSVSYQAFADMLIYASASRGFRSGGFNQYSPAVPRAFLAETTDSAELGVRLSCFEDKLLLHAALFRNDQENAQVTRFNPSTFTLENVAIDDVRADGLEVEGALRLTERLSLRFGYGATNAKIRAFAANPGLVGTSMPYVPKSTLTISARYAAPLGDALRVAGEIGYQRYGPRSFSLDFPALVGDPHTFLNARLSLEAGKWSIDAYADNLLNERQPEDLFGVFNGPVELARQPSRPRHVGLEVRYAIGAGWQVND